MWVVWLRRALLVALGLAGATAAAVAAFGWADARFPPPLPVLATVSTEVLDRNGALLRAFPTPDGRWRLAVDLDAVDPRLPDMLVAYEDKRFFAHDGIDPLAMLRSAGQLLSHGRIVSGGSTLSMQLARLIEPRAGRSLAAKLRQAFRAVQIERRLSKREILARYLTLAPYGGNLEGVRAAALAYFGKEPRRLSVAEAALLVALPQVPERRRPDRQPELARAARARVLDRLVADGKLEPAEAARAAAEPMPDGRRPLPALAAHVAAAALGAAPSAHRLSLTLDRAVQARLEPVAQAAAARLGPRLSVAMVLADAANGDILAAVGSAGAFDTGRFGYIDMTRQLRSPGSTLKPFIYGLAFEQGLIAQETVIEDRPADFGGYRPKNFDMTYQGEVSVREALQLSLNVPAIRLLDAVGPARLIARFRRVGVEPVLPRGDAPGLAIGLGGVGISLRDLVQLYAGLANGGRAPLLRDGSEAAPPPAAGTEILEPQAAWQVADMLAGVRPPAGAMRRGIAYKTGTSYGYRDAWSVGFDGRHVLGVWVGRADGAAVPGLAGYVSAAPILFEAFERSGLAAVPLPGPPAGALRQARRDLPVTLARFSPQPDGRAGPAAAAPLEPPPQIVFPPDGARIDLTGSGGAPLTLKLQDGRPPFRWLANGRPLAAAARRRGLAWQPDGAGTSTLTVIDAAGRAASVTVSVE